MSTLPPPSLNANMVHLWRMLLEHGHSIKVSSNRWEIDSKLSFYPDDGRYRPKSSHGKGGTLRGGAETIFEHLHGMLIAT